MIAVLLYGKNSNTRVVGQFISLLVEKGKDYVQLIRQSGTEAMRVDIGELDDTTNLEAEVDFVIETAKDIKRYEKKRNRIIRKALKKVVLTTDRRNIN